MHFGPAVNRELTAITSVSGYCGTTDDHCNPEKGCQSDFGNCTTDAEQPENPEDRGFSVKLF